MRYTEKDIDRIPLTEFLKALGEKPRKINGDLALYYAPHRDDPEPMLCIDTRANRWYDHATDETGDLRDLAAVAMNPNVYRSPSEYILKMMNEFEIGKEMYRVPQRQTIVIDLDIKNLPLTEFMTAIGSEPVKREGNLVTYDSPYESHGKPTMVVNTAKNTWRDTESGAYGGIYDLAYELTGSCSMSELNLYIATQMSGYQKNEAKQTAKVEPPKPEPPKPKRRIKF